MKIIKYSLLLFVSLTAGLFPACDMANNDILPDERFSKIIADTDFDAVYHSQGIIETADNGFLVLASYHNEQSTYTWLTPQVSKLNAEGELNWSVSLPEPYVNPVGELLNINDRYFLLCMHQTSLNAQLLEINDKDGSITPAASFSELMYPLAVSANPDGSLLLLSYDTYAQKTYLTHIGTDFSIQQSQSFSVYEDVEELVINSLIKRGKQYPFFTGSTDTHFYFNGLHNYSFSLVFVDKTKLNYTGVLNGYRYSGVVSSVENISAGRYAFSTFFEGNNYLYPAEAISETGTASVENLSGTVIAQLQPDAKVASARIIAEGNERIVFASSTKDNQIILLYYDTEGNFTGNQIIADNYPIEISDLIQCSDGNLVLTGRTFVNGQFPRVFVNKLAID